MNLDKKVMMDENEFWNVIAMFDWKHEGDDDKVLKKAVNYLAKKDNEDIYKFYEILSKLLHDLDGIEYAKNMGEYSYVDEYSPFSADGFLYSRCAVVANGRAFYYRVLINPKDMIKDIDFEALLYLAPDAFEKKNKFPFSYQAEYSYETFSNEEKWVLNH